MSAQVEKLLQLCREKGLKLRTAESCSAGAIAAEIASVSGASDVLDRGWIVYTNLSKISELGVSPEIIDEYGAVSWETVMAMAEGGSSESSICVAVSGIAGPGGGTDEKPVGTVWIAVAGGGYTPVAKHQLFSGDRAAVQRQTVASAIHILIETLENRP